jgi:hypothetical protein
MRIKPMEADSADASFGSAELIRFSPPDPVKSHHHFS